MRQRIDHRVHRRRGCADRAQLAHALHAQAVGQAGDAGVEGRLEATEAVHARQGVVHVAGAQQLAFGVIGHGFAQGLADALHRAAFDLAFDDDRADHAANVADAGVGHDFDRAGGRVHFHLAAVGGVGPAGGAGLGFAVGGDHRAGLALRQFKQADAQVGAGDREAAFPVFDVGGRRFQRFSGQVLGLGDGVVGRHGHRRAAGEQRTAARAAEAVGAVGVALQHADAFRRHAEHVHRQLHIAGDDALAHGHGGRGQFDETVGRHAHLHLLFQGHATGPFQEGGQTAAAQLAARLRFRAAGVEAVVVGQGLALRQQAGELAAVIGLAHRVAVGHLIGPDHVAAAQFGRVHLHLACGGVEQTFDDVDGLGPAGAAVGAGGGGVRQHRADLQVDGRDVVDAGQDPRADQQLDGHTGTGDVAAHIGQ